MGKVYLLESNNDGYVTYKIGITSGSVTKRLHQMQTGNPATIRIVNSYESDNYVKLENILHHVYKKYNIRGEWFSDKIKIEEFIEVCELNDKLIETLKKTDNYFI